MLFYVYLYKNKELETPNTFIGIVILLRIIYDFIVLIVVFFDKNFERLY